MDVAADADRQRLRVGPGLDVRAQAAVLRGHARRAGARLRHRGSPGPREARRLGDHRPHLAGGVDQGRLAGRRLPAGARRRPPGLQLLRVAPGQPRGDDPRHLRQHPAAEPARAGDRGRRHAGLHPGRRGHHDLRRRAELRQGRDPPGDPRRQGVRLGIVARLGRQGHRAARGQGRHRRVLRADPPIEPDRHGRAAAAVPRRGDRRVARASPARRSSRSAASPRSTTGHPLAR